MINLRQRILSNATMRVAYVSAHTHYQKYIAAGKLRMFGVTMNSWLGREREKRGERSRCNGKRQRRDGVGEWPVGISRAGGRSTEEGQGHRRVEGRGQSLRNDQRKQDSERMGSVNHRVTRPTRTLFAPSAVDRRPPWQLGTNRCHSPLTYPNLTLETETDRSSFPAFPCRRVTTLLHLLPFVLAAFIIF